MPGILRQKLLLRTVDATATSSNWIPVDPNFNTSDQSRSIIGVRSSVSDEFQILVRNKGRDPLTDAITYTTATATIFSSGPATQFSCVILGPFSELKVVKVGAAGTATVIGVI